MRIVLIAALLVVAGSANAARDRTPMQDIYLPRPQVCDEEQSKAVYIQQPDGAFKLHNIYPCSTLPRCIKIDASIVATSVYTQMPGEPKLQGIYDQFTCP